MDYDNLVAKLALDLEARKDRDRVETAAWFNAEEIRLRVELVQNAKELGVSENDPMVYFEYKQKLENLERERQARIAEQQKRQAEIDSQIIKGEIGHVWVSEKDEQIHSVAKQEWDIQTKNYTESNKPIPQDILNSFKNDYGTDIYNELKHGPQRDIEIKRKQEDIAKKQEAERIRLEKEKQDRERRKRLHEAMLENARKMKIKR